MKLLSSLFLTRLIAVDAFNFVSLQQPAFAPQQTGVTKSSAASLTQLNALIKGTKDGDLIDEGLGGVRLTMESAIKVVGEYKAKDDNMKLTDMVRYTKPTEFDMAQYASVMSDCGNRVVCTGYGKECYHDPGETTIKRVQLAPIEAANDALKSLQSKSAVGDASTLMINILGGDDLMVHEAIDAVKEIVSGLEIPNKCKIIMNSLCHSSFPEADASVTVIASGEGSKGGFSGIAKSIAYGDVYGFRGKWWTVVEEDINTAIE